MPSLIHTCPVWQDWKLSPCPTQSTQPVHMWSPDWARTGQSPKPWKKPDNITLLQRGRPVFGWRLGTMPGTRVRPDIQHGAFDWRYGVRSQMVSADPCSRSRILTAKLQNATNKGSESSAKSAEKPYTYYPGACCQQPLPLKLHRNERLFRRRECVLHARWRLSPRHEYQY